MLASSFLPLLSPHNRHGLAVSCLAPASWPHCQLTYFQVPISMKGPQQNGTSTPSILIESLIIDNETIFYMKKNSQIKLLDSMKKKMT
ncbi:hypothetical protein DsansV1_C35g0231071 [Dioscorea sansibarensis]